MWEIQLKNYKNKEGSGWDIKLFTDNAPQVIRRETRLEANIFGYNSKQADENVGQNRDNGS